MSGERGALTDKYTNCNCNHCSLILCMLGWGERLDACTNSSLRISSYTRAANMHVVCCVLCVLHFCWISWTTTTAPAATSQKTAFWRLSEVRRTCDCARKQFLFFDILIFFAVHFRCAAATCIGIWFWCILTFLVFAQNDLLGQSLLNLTHPDDQADLKRYLIPTDLERLFAPQPEDENGEPRARTAEEEAEIDHKLKEDKRNFTIRLVRRLPGAPDVLIIDFHRLQHLPFHRLARAGPRSEPTAYENVHFNGSFRRADAAPRGMKNSNYPPGLQMLRRPRCGRDESIPLHTIGSNDIVSVISPSGLRHSLTFCLCSHRCWLRW